MTTVEEITAMLKNKFDVGWHIPQTVDLPPQLSFPARALAIWQLYNRELWTFFLGEGWWDSEIMLEPEHDAA